MPVSFEMINEHESWGIFNNAAMREFGISGAELMELWNEGFYKGDQENTKAMRVVMLYPRTD